MKLTFFKSVDFFYFDFFKDELVIRELNIVYIITII